MSALSCYIPGREKPKPEAKGTAYEFESWSELKHVVSDIYHKEVQEDELEREKLWKQIEAEKQSK